MILTIFGRECRDFDDSLARESLKLRLLGARIVKLTTLGRESHEVDDFWMREGLSVHCQPILANVL